MSVNDLTQFLKLGYKECNGRESRVFHALGVNLTESERAWFYKVMVDAVHVVTRTGLTILNSKYGSIHINSCTRDQSMTLLYFSKESSEGKAFLMDQDNREKWMEYLNKCIEL